MNKETKRDRIEEIIRSYYSRESQNSLHGEQLIKKLFEEWIANDQDKEAKMRVVEQLWEEESGDSETMTTERIYAMAKRMGLSVPNRNEDSPRRSMSLKRLLFRVAAVLIPAALILGGVVFYNNAGEDELYASEFTSLRGEIVSSELRDGSKVTINSDSRLAVVQNKGVREVELTGEGYFEVARDENRPFVVRVDNLTITVLGTKFNVEAYDDRLYSVITITDGRVGVAAAGGEKWELEKGEKLTFDKSRNVGEVRRYHLGAVEVGWMNGWLDCEMMTLREIFTAIERQLNVDIEIASTAMLTETRYSVRMAKDDDLSRILDVLRATSYHSFDYIIEEGKVIIK